MSTIPLVQPIHVYKCSAENISVCICMNYAITTPNKMSMLRNLHNVFSKKDFTLLTCVALCLMLDQTLIDHALNYEMIS